MRVTTIERLHQLQTTPSFFPVNCYLFEEADSLTLIDAASGSTQRRSITIFESKRNRLVQSS